MASLCLTPLAGPHRRRVGLGVALAAGWAVAGRPAGSAHVTAFWAAFWAGNRCRELLLVGLAERLEPASFRGAGGFGDGGLQATGGFAGFAGLQGITRVLGNLGIASQLLQQVVVVSYFYYYPFYIQFGWCCDWVSNAKLSKRFCIR